MSELYKYFDFITSMDPWTWMTLSVLFLIMEMFAGVILFLLLSLTCASMAIAVFFIPDMILQNKLLLISLLLGLWIFIIYLYYRLKGGYKQSFKKRGDVLNDRFSQLVGRKTQLSDDIKNGIGKVSVDGVLWQVKTTCGRTFKKGETVCVVGTDNKYLLIKKIHENSYSCVENDC